MPKPFVRTSRSRSGGVTGCRADSGAGSLVRIAVITLAAIYAEQAMHFTTQQTILLIFVVNITAAVGAPFFLYLLHKKR